MTPKEFIAAWEGMNSERLARLTRRSKSVVDHWLVDESKSSYKEPPREVRDYLGTVHVIWTLLETVDSNVSRNVVSIYNEVKDDQK